MALLASSCNWYTLSSHSHWVFYCLQIGVELEVEYEVCVLLLLGLEEAGGKPREGWGICNSCCFLKIIVASELRRMQVCQFLNFYLMRQEAKIRENVEEKIWEEEGDTTDILSAWIFKAESFHWAVLLLSHWTFTLSESYEYIFEYIHLLCTITNPFTSYQKYLRDGETIWFSDSRMS